MTISKVEMLGSERPMTHRFKSQLVGVSWSFETDFLCVIGLAVLVLAL